MAGRKHRFFQDLAETCPQMVGRELYLNLRPSIPERKFVLLSGGEIKDCHTDIIFDSRMKWLQSLAETVPEMKELQEQQTTSRFTRISLANFTYTLPGKSGWKLEKIMRYIRINEDKTIDAEMFFQPLRFGHMKKANSSQEGRNDKSLKQTEHTAQSLKGKERRFFSNFFQDLANACPELVGREFYLSFKRVPERKFVLLSGGKIKDCPTDTIFFTRGKWLKTLVDTVPEIKALRQGQADFAKTSLAKFSYTLPGRGGWKMTKIMRHIKINGDKMIDAEMFFQPCTKTKPGPRKKAKPPKKSCDDGSMKKAEDTAESGKDKEQRMVQKKVFSNFFEELAEVCPPLVGREFYLSFNPSVPERKFVLLTGGKIKDCHTNIIFDSRMKWLQSLAETVPEIKELKEQQTSSSFTRISLATYSYSLPGRSGWRMTKIMRHIRMKEDKAIDVEMYFQPSIVKRGRKKKAKPLQDSCDTDVTKKPEHTAESLKEKEKNARDKPLHDSQGTDSMDQSEHTAKSMKEKEKNASDNLPQDSQGAESMDQSGNTAESVKEKEKNASDIQLVNRVQIEECEMDQRNADPDHSYASHSLSKASPSSCSRPSISAEDMWFKEGESLSPEELVLYGLLLVRGKHPGGKKAAKLECFTTQAGNDGGFTSVATAANRVSAASKYSAEGIKTYLSLGHQPVGRYKGNFRWEHFLSEVQDLVEKQGRNLHLLLSGADDIDMQGIRDTAANICEENRVQQASLCPSNTGLNLKSLQEVWKDKLRDQWTHCHLTCSESKAMIHFLSPADSSSPVLQKTIHIHQDMTWVLKVRGQTCTRKLWGDLTSTVSNLSQLRTVLQFVQDGFVCIGCDYDRFSEVMDRTVVADVKVESLGELTSVRSEQCVLFTTNYYKVWKMKGTNSDHVDAKNVCHMCRKKNNDLEAVLNWLNDHKAKGTITSTTSSEFTPRRTLEQQLREKRVQRNQEKCHKTIQTLRERLRETKAELAAAQEKLDRVKSRPRELLITRQELATLQKEVLSRRSVTIRGTLV